MRGDAPQQGMMFATVVLEDRIPADHPLRAIRAMVDPILRDLSPQFDALYSRTGRPSIPPEQLLRALLLQILFTIRSERQLVEQLQYNLLYRWFVGLDLETEAWHATTFTKNRERLQDGGIAAAFMAGVLELAARHQLLSNDHFSVDGTLLEAWASQKSVRRKDASDQGPIDPDNTGVDWHGERRTNATHASVTDPDARMARKSNHTASILAYQATIVTENRHGLVVAGMVTPQSGTAECENAVLLLHALPSLNRRRTVGADKGFDTGVFVEGARAADVTPHVARKAKGSAVDDRTTRHAGYVVSQRKRKAIEEVFGWGKLYGLLRKLRHRGVATVDWIHTFTLAAYNLVRLRRLLSPAG